MTPAKTVAFIAAIWVVLSPLIWVVALSRPTLVEVKALIWVVANSLTWVEEKAPKAAEERPAI